MNLDDIIETAIEKQSASVKVAISKGYPSEIRYFCWIHGRQEVAKCSGYWYIDEEEPSFALYNTPDGYTLGFEMLMQMSSNTLPLSEWVRYGYEQPTKQMEEPKQPYVYEGGIDL